MATFSSHETQAQAPRPPNPQDFATAAVDPNRLGGPSWAFAGAVWIVASSPGPCCVLHAGSTLVCSPILLGGHCGQASSSKLFMHPSSKDSLGNTCMHIYIYNTTIMQSYISECSLLQGALLFDNALFSTTFIYFLQLTPRASRVELPKHAVHVYHLASV